MEERQSGYGASQSCTRITLVSGKASATTSMETRGTSSVTRATNDVACGNSGCSSRGNADSKDDHVPGSGWPSHVAGQHVDVRLTAPDGYSAVRSYSIASAPNAEGRVELTVERLPDGEVSLSHAGTCSRGSSGIKRSDPWLVRVAIAANGTDPIDCRRFRHRPTYGDDSLPSIGGKHCILSIAVFGAGTRGGLLP